MSTHFLKRICAFKEFLSCLRHRGESGVIGQKGVGCTAVDIGRFHKLHLTGPGEVQVTCFIPTVVPFHKKQKNKKKNKGKPSHSLSICLKLVEKVLLRLDSVSCCV